MLLTTVVTTVLLPLLVIVALGVDLLRFVIDGGNAILSRGIVFGWIYLIGESWAIVALGLAALLGKRRSITATHRLQKSWARWNVDALRIVFGIGIVVEGSEAVAPGPIVVLSRHVSLIDSLLPADVVAASHGIRLRYVLKKELLLDPALDIAGNRLENHFVDRKSRDAEAELSAIRELASDLGSGEGVVIFPEGTRFTEEKLNREKRRAGGKRDANASLITSYRSVLPPRTAGTLALLEEAQSDVVFLAHHGLEGFAGLSDIWSGQLVGSTISVAMWRVPYEEIPVGHDDRVGWLYENWARVDGWIGQKAASRQG